MNAKQLELAITSIGGDCDISGYMKDEEGKTCAIGGLAESAGIRTGKWNNRFDTVIGGVRKFYGLSDIQVYEIMNINDTYAKPTTRRKHIVKYLNNLELKV